MTIKAELKAHLLAGHSITQLESIANFQCYRLAARIHDLRNEGMVIQTSMQTNPTTGNQYARYAALPPTVINWGDRLRDALAAGALVRDRQLHNNIGDSVYG